MLVLFLAAFPSIKGFLTTPSFSCGYVPQILSRRRVLPATNVPNFKEFNSSDLESFLEQSTQSPSRFSLRLNNSRLGPTGLSEDVLANRNMTVNAYQITRPRWYNRAEATIIVFLVQRLQMLDVRSVEHMLESTQGYRKADPEEVLQRALFLMKAAPGADFRMVIRRHPKTLLVPIHNLERMCGIINSAYPGVNMARIVERIPSVFSRNPDRLKRNIEGLKEHAPEVDKMIFQSAPSMIFVPPETTQAKVESIRSHLPGVRLYNFLKGFPTGLTRSTKTIPQGMAELRRRFPESSTRELVRMVEAAPSLMRMTGTNGTLDARIGSLTEVIPGVNVTSILANAPGVLVRNRNSVADKVGKLATLFPSANVTKIVSRTPAIVYLDIDGNVALKARWIKDALGLSQDALDLLVESGPWVLKAGWGPLARLEFAVETGILRTEQPGSLVGILRRSRTSFTAAYHPAYANFLRDRLRQEDPEWCLLDTDRRDDHMNTGGDEAEAEAEPEADDGRVSRQVAEDVARMEDRLGRLRKSGIKDIKDRTSQTDPGSPFQDHGVPDSQSSFTGVAG